MTTTLDVRSQENAKTGTVTLDPAVFGVAPRAHLFHAEVRRQLAKRRAGTHATKNRSLVSGGGAKPWKQKGTGRARQGSSRSPQWAGGGVVFGPVPRSHEHVLNKKTRRAALIAALSQRAGEQALCVVDRLVLAEAKTRRMVELLQTLGLGNQGVLIVLAERDAGIERAARNIPYVSVIAAAGLNTHDVLRHPQLLMTRAALEAIEQRLAGASKEASA